VLRVTPSQSANAALKYFDEGLKRDDYYLKGEEVKANWLGKGAERLGLSGNVEREDFAALVRNRDPKTGKRLTPRDRKDRRPGYDATLTAWKSPSIMEALYGCSDMREAFWRVGDRMMTEKAEPWMHTRVRKDGKDYDRVTGNMVAAAFRHLLSRPVDGKSDPHMHTHYYLINGTHDGVEERWKAAQLGELKSKAPDLQLEFDAMYAKEMLEMGYVPVMGRKGVQLAGVPQSVIDKFSRNSKRIEKEAAELGVADSKGKHKLHERLREDKDADLPRDELFADWMGRLTPEEKAALQKVRDKQIPRTREISPREAVDYAVNHLFQREDVVTERELRKTAVHYGIGYVMPDDADKEIAGALERGEILRKDGAKGAQYVKGSTLKDQLQMTQRSREGRGQYEPLAESYRDVPELSAEQNKVACEIVESRDKYTGIRGPAGTGKSYSLKAIKGVIEERRARGEEKFSDALALAPSSSASRGELAKAGYDNATTLAAFFTSERMQQKYKGQVLFVDEAGMMSTTDMTKLMDIAEKNDNRVIFLGDYRQHASVDAGDAFRLLEKEGGIKYALLTQNRRQRDEAFREAVDLIGSGDAKKAQRGMKTLDKKGWIVEMKDAGKRQDFLVGQFLQAKDEGATALIVGTTNREGAEITARLREELKSRGRILGDERQFPSRLATVWTDAQKADSRNYEPGMVVEFHTAVPGVRKQEKGRRETVGGFERGETALVVEGGNTVLLARRDGTLSPLPMGFAERFQVYRSGQQSVAKGDQLRITKNGMLKVKGQAEGVRVNNGDIYPVEGFTKEGDIRLPGGKTLPRDYGHFTLGYTDTSYRSQSKTVDRVFIAVDEHAPKATDRTQWYVSWSRGRDAGLAVVADKKSAMATVNRGGERLSALEFMKDSIGVEKVTVRRRLSLAALLEKNRIGRFLKARATALRESAQTWVGRLRRQEGLQRA
jgi:conjugative relaxase-like TrwC/TraI family protein